MAGKFRSKEKFESMTKTAMLDRDGKLVDERLWVIENRSQSKVYTMRLIPFFSEKLDELSGYRKILKHNIKFAGKDGKQKTVGSICPKTWDENAKCPYCDVIGPDKNIDWTITEQKDFYKMFFAKPSYISNIFMLDDKNNPENNDKIWLHSFGKQAFGPVLDQIAPTAIIKAKRSYKEFQPYGYETADYDLTFTDEKSTDNGYCSYADSEFINDTLGIYKNKESEQDKLIESAYNLDDYISELEKKYNFGTVQEFMNSRIGHLLSDSGLEAGEYSDTEDEDDSISDTEIDEIAEVEAEIDEIAEEVKEVKETEEVKDEDIEDLDGVF